MHLGVFDEGHLNFASVGISLDGVGDGIISGCLCEGWGVGIVSINGGAPVEVAGWASSVDTGGIFNITNDSFSASDADLDTFLDTATASVSLTAGASLSVTHIYAPAYVDGGGGALFKNAVTITNTSGTDTYNGIRYRRVMDWNIPPTGFSEFVTIAGLPASNLIFTNDDGFDTPDPFGGTIGDLSGCGESVNFVDCGPDDHGVHFDFDFGDLLPGQSRSFSIFYGATYSEAAAIEALNVVGAEVYSLGQSSTASGATLGTPATWIVAFDEVGGSSLPEPTSLALVCTGLIGLALARRRRRVPPP